MLLFLVLCVLGEASANTTAAPVCERAPPHAQPADALYKIGVAGDPDLFLPGELYTGRFDILVNNIHKFILKCFTYFYILR